MVVGAKYQIRRVRAFGDIFDAQRKSLKFQFQSGYLPIRKLVDFVEHLSHKNGQRIDLRVEHVRNASQHRLQFGNIRGLQTGQELLKEGVFGVDFRVGENHSDDSKI